MSFPPLLCALLEAAGPSGYESAPVQVWRRAAEQFASQVSVDVLGSCAARLPGTQEGPRLALIGHIDEIGLVVTHVDEQGFLWFRSVGGWDSQILVGQRVEVLTREGPVAGVVGKKPIHLLREEERKKVPELRELHIDVGARDRADALRRVRLGDVAVIAGVPVEVGDERVVSRALDNRLGAYVALEAARRVAQGGGRAGELVAVAAVQEEITFAGSRTTAYALEPDVAIVLDVTHATDAPGIEVKETGEHALGSGPTINRGSTIHPAVFELLHETAEAEQIPFTVEASGRATGTDADAVHLSRSGVATGVVSIPLRYMHSPVELVALEDVEATVALVSAFAQALTAERGLRRD